MPEPRVAVSTLGEAMLRLSVRAGDRLLDAPAYQVHPGGSEANVAYALAQVGVASAWSSVLPHNLLAERIAATLIAGGVDLSGVVWTDTGRVGTYFVELATEPRGPSVVYDRAGSAMCAATPDLFDWDLVCSARILHVSGITFGLSAGTLDVCRQAINEARRRGCRVSLDVNYRTLLWTPAAAAAALREQRGVCDLVIATAEDARDVFGLEGEPEDLARGLQAELDCPAVALTIGAQGAVLAEGDAVTRRPAFQVQAVDRIGSGDAFAAGLLWGWLDGSLVAGLERGIAMAALKMTLHGDLFRLGAEDVHRLLAGSQRRVRR
ncbi:MAG TPA: sugar kinase [Candidatus Dormibacteraeota bacterium]